MPKSVMVDIRNCNRVSVSHFQGKGDYSSGDGADSVEAMIRDALANLGLDQEHRGSPAWNPLGDLVEPGAKIVVKPNWVLHKNEGGGSMDCVVTHPSVLKAMLEYVVRAKPGEIIVGDAPIQGCDFERLMSFGFRDAVDSFRERDVPIRVVDFRRTVLSRKGNTVAIADDLRPEDRYVTVDLAGKSLLEPLSQQSEAFRVTMYEPDRMRNNHATGRHRYVIAREVLDADLVVNLPKLKTHKKAGMTAALKNLVGINGNKDCLPHHRKGAGDKGGDAYEKSSFLKTLAGEVADLADRNIRNPKRYGFLHRVFYHLLVLDRKLGGDGEIEGSWHGNDTVWRTCLDLNRILIHADSQGRLYDEPRRVELTLIDGIIAGQGEGPLRPVPAERGLVVASLNPAAADWISALALGLDPRRIPVVAQAFQSLELPITKFDAQSVECILNGQPIAHDEFASLWPAPVHPAAGWADHCELSAS